MIDDIKMEFKERDLTRLSYLVSAIIASPHLYKELIDMVIGRGGNEYFIRAITLMKQEIEKANLDFEKASQALMITRGTPEFHAGVCLRMAYLANPPKKL
jgi:hypothetical protein